MDINVWIAWLAMENMQDEFPHLWLGEYITDPNKPCDNRKMIFFPEDCVWLWRRPDTEIAILVEAVE